MARAARRKRSEGARSRGALAEIRIPDEPKIENHRDATLIHENVRRLQIAVNAPRRWGLESASRSATTTGSSRSRKGSASGQLHHEEWRVFKDPRVEKLDHSWQLDLPEGGDLALEPFEAGRLTGVEHLDRARGAASGIIGTIDDAAPPEPMRGPMVYRPSSSIPVHDSRGG